MIPARGKIVGAYVNSALSKTDAQLSGFDEAIVLSQNGHVSEGSAENIFMVKNGVFITPPVTENISKANQRIFLIGAQANAIRARIRPKTIMAARETNR